MRRATAPWACGSTFLKPQRRTGRRARARPGREVRNDAGTSSTASHVHIPLRCSGRAASQGAPEPLTCRAGCLIRGTLREVDRRTRLDRGRARRRGGDRHLGASAPKPGRASSTLRPHDRGQSGGSAPAEAGKRRGTSIRAEGIVPRDEALVQGWARRLGWRPASKSRAKSPRPCSNSMCRPYARR
jgi:hypothetical protein